MYKTKILSVTVLLLTVFPLTSGSKLVGAAPMSPVPPFVVATGVLTNQTAPFSATIYTPTYDGLHRFSAYATTTTADANSESGWIYGFSWTDVTGQEQRTDEVLSSYDDQVGQFYTYTGASNAVFQGGFTRTFQATKSTPITHFTSLAGTPDNSAYAVYYALERVQ